MKEQILKKIYTLFSRWNSTGKIACRRRCAVCCTRNVTITALEGEIILRYVIHNNIEHWFAEKLRQDMTHHRPPMTTNDFARALPAAERCGYLRRIKPGSLPLS